MTDEADGWTKDAPWLGQYILDENGNTVPAKSLLGWAMWMQTGKRQLALDLIGRARVSTIFMGLDHHLMRDEPHQPILWETMVFGGPYDRHQQRYASKEEALRGHAKIVQMLTS